MPPINELMHEKAPDSVHTAGLILQPGGMFATPGLENEVVSTHIVPKGIGSILPVFASNTDDPRFGLLTGVSDDIGSEPVNVCDDAPTGFIKGGTLTAQFGRLARQTPTIEVTKLLRNKSGINTNLQLIGEMFGDSPWKPNMTTAQMLDLVVKSEMVGAGVRLERLASKITWQGAVANNTAGGGYKEWPGLDAQISTGQVDAETGVALPSAASTLFDFNFSDVDGTAKDIVRYLSELEYQLNYHADNMGLTPVSWVIVMRPQLWWELTAVWPCRYATNRCTTITNTNPIVINDMNNITMRDDMRRRMMIPINGTEYRVVLDTGIFEYNNANSASCPAGTYASMIAMVPLRMVGNFPCTYWEHVDYRSIPSELAPLGRGINQLPFWTDGGRFLWTLDFLRTCFDLQVSTEPRIVLRTPFLAGKIQKIRYTPMQHVREADPDSPYWVDGGVSVRSVPTSYAVWK